MTEKKTKKEKVIRCSACDYEETNS
jgi:hypothetical protein